MSIFEGQDGNLLMLMYRSWNPATLLRQMNHTCFTFMLAGEFFVPSLILDCVSAVFNVIMFRQLYNV